MVVTLSQQYTVGEKPTVILRSTVHLLYQSPSRATKHNETENNVLHS